MDVGKVKCKKEKVKALTFDHGLFTFGHAHNGRDEFHLVPFQNKIWGKVELAPPSTP
jgi:hypothetical protein